MLGLSRRHQQLVLVCASLRTSGQPRSKTTGRSRQCFTATLGCSPALLLSGTCPPLCHGQKRKDRFSFLIWILWWPRKIFRHVLSPFSCAEEERLLETSHRLDVSKFFHQERFRMETLLTICQAVQPGDWMISIDLKDAYFHVPIAEDFQKFLRFAVNHTHLQFTCLLFGLTT